MSDQDFFFDEEDEKPARSEKTSPGKTAAAKSSSGKTAAAKPAAKPEPEPATGSFFERQLNAGVASLLVVCALLLGLVAGILVGEARANSAIAGVPAYDPTAVTGGGQAAPQLTQEQLNSGQLPAGHPSVAGTGSAVATGSTAATGN